MFFIFLLGLTVEIIGVNFSIFFGEYKYGNNLGIKIFDVPIVIGFNWVLLIVLTGNFADRIFPKSILRKVLFGSTIMILLDLLIEISAPKLDYWEFANHPVPFSNYLWWFIFSVLFHFIYESNIKKAEELYKKSIKLNSKIPEANSNLGNLYNSIGKNEESIKYHKLAILADPKYLFSYLF